MAQHHLTPDPDGPRVEGRLIAAEEHLDGELRCLECSGPVWVDAAGVSYHWGEGLDDTDHDLDADHVAVPEEA